MNYLAHLYLASNDAESIIGSLMGDFVKGRVDPDLPATRRAAILQHRRIDSFTDAHAVVKRSKQRIRPEFRRYAGILIDVFYDHFLATAWPTYAKVPLDDFTENIYGHINRQLHGLPPRMQQSMRYMLAHDLLGSYRSVQGIGQALRGIETRLRRPNRLGEAIGELEASYGPLCTDFSEFFPLLIRFVDEDEAMRPRPEFQTHR